MGNQPSDPSRMNSSEEPAQLSLLLVDDDRELCAMMKEFLSHTGHRLDCSHDGRDGLSRAVNGSYDLVLLDVMLPSVNGFTVMRQLRRRTDVPVILLTARTHQEDRIAGLNSGADDYLPKPFDPDELVARIRAVLRRGGKVKYLSRSAEKYGDISVNFDRREVVNRGYRVDLTALEFDLLEMLVRAAGRVVSREEITVALLDRVADPYDRALDVHISHLRGKLQRAGKLIRTVRGVGYVFAALPGPRR